ncbi:MAG: 4-(cytidine 5'-diphospho)-2-C-methyl-D-erythritol kinase [Candidatus Melainabacteria bacterium]|nr:4-(cytidine 5'-diphospho)-2-C-methyl-D-erythritol kinase [Candidatus Melainabacteria bacterium]
MVLTKKAVYVERAPAKINLFLDILDKRDDGYHDIETIFQAINLEDFLTFEISVDVAEQENEISEAIEFELEIDSDSEAVRGLGLSNLVTRAVEAYFASIPAHDDKADLIDMISTVKLSIFIDKRIPMQAGLAGASADAAATLRALNNFFYENFNWSLSEKELLEIALELGSDVPFCLRSLKQSRIYAESRGEKFKELKTDFDFDSFNQVLVVKPQFGIETAQAYKLVSSYKPKKHRKIEFYNAFENPIFDNYPELLQIQEALLKAGCDHVLLSGSGSSILGFVNKEKNLKSIAQEAGESLSDCQLFECSFN